MEGKGKRRGRKVEGKCGGEVGGNCGREVEGKGKES